jgi:hypothetical protein
MASMMLDAPRGSARELETALENGLEMVDE